MSSHKALNFVMSIAMIVSLLFGGIVPASAQETPNPVVAGSTSSMPMNPTDETKVPHYFGPYPNWANSPLTLPDVSIDITGGGGSGATATATVGANGAITGITITNPGGGYTSAPNIVFNSATGTGASASATVSTSGVVTAVSVDAGGGGYTSPIITFGAGGPNDATGTVYGSLDAITVNASGSGYTVPTIDIDLPDDPNGVPARAHAAMDTNGAITAVIIDNPGSGYSAAPKVVIRDGTIFDPINNGGSGATATATLTVQSVFLNTFGSGYTSAPSAVITEDPNGQGASHPGSGALATAFTDFGAVIDISLTNGGTNYVTPGGIKKFQDDLPGLCDPATPGSCPTSGKYIPLAVPQNKIYNDGTGPIAADEYVIGLVQYRTSFSSSLPPTLVRGYVQIETSANSNVSQHFPLTNANIDPNIADSPVLINGVQAYGVTPPQWLGPTIAATKDKPVRIVFRNLLPTGADGNLFLPVDSSLMGSGMAPMDNMSMPEPYNDSTVMDEVRNPPCTDNPQAATMGMDLCYQNNRATLHLHGGTTPWISDGTPHQWITPAGENTSWPEGVSVKNVPDMLTNPADPNSPVVCDAKDDGCQTFFYTNQQSARLLFYHDHAWGITRLNVYAGEAAGYLISDATEAGLISSGAIPADQIPLVVQDRTFVPDAAQLALQDPTWDAAHWGSKGSFWYHHVYMPAQNPGDPSGMSAYGRWMYGPWFWPPAADTVYGPIDNPYYDPKCNLDDPKTWTYQTDPFCEPQQIPGTPNISVGMEQFNDTPVVNGVAYPKVTLDPKPYRLRILNAANDRFFNFQWYVADPRTGTLSEVALKQSELDAAQTDPNVFPTPDTAISPAGPSWIQIGTEGGFLPAPAVIPNQPITWIIDPTRFDFGNVDQHSLLIAPAERADVIVDFSKFAGKTLILYNDAPAAFPARVASYDYYTGDPDLTPVGAPTTLPGYGPNTRTIMQVTISNGTQTSFNLTKLRNAFKHNVNGTGVFEAGQHPIIVGQAAYNSAYGTNFAASSNCNAPSSPLQRCDGFVRISDTQTFGFNTLRGQNIKMTMPLQPKAIHDEMNATTFDEYGRMQANLGVEAQPPTPGLQNVTLYPYVNPGTEFIDGTNLQTPNIAYDVNGNVVTDFKITPISTANDGSQIWRITHNGVDTHPIHFHLFDVQLINRVTWDNIIMAPDANELGWKDTVRVSPLQDTIVALRPIIPKVPFEVPNSIRMLNPMMPKDSTAMFNNIAPDGTGTNTIMNQLVNFGWEYVYHCHILSHEEMDMMRPVSLVIPPNQPTWANPAYTVDSSGLTLNWNDNSINETAFVVQRMDSSLVWTTLTTIISPLDPTGQSNIHEARSYTDSTYVDGNSYQYRIIAQNTAGYLDGTDPNAPGFPEMTAQSVSSILVIGNTFPPDAPSALTAAVVAGPKVQLQWTDNASTETGFTIERAPVTNGVIGTFAAIDGVGANITTYTDITVGGNTVDTSYAYRVFAFNGSGNSLPAPSATDPAVTVLVPAPPFVASIVLVSPNPTGAATVSFNVTFSKPVTGVDMTGPVFNDFTLATTGTVTGSFVKSVSGSGKTYTVTVNTGSGTGNLGLNLIDNDTIVDALSNPLGGTGLGNGNFTGPAYTLNRTVPTVLSITATPPNPTNAASVAYTVTFSEPVTGVDMTGPVFSDFTLALSGVTGASVTNVSGSGATYTVTVNTGTGSGTLGLNLVDRDTIANASNNPLAGVGLGNGNFTGDVYTLDKTAPTVSSIALVNPSPTNAASVDYTVTFSEPVTGVDAADFTPNLSSGITGASVTNVASVSTTVYTVTVDTGTGSGTLGLDVLVSPNTVFSDLVGNSFVGPSFTGSAYTIDKTAPTVAITLGPTNPTGAVSVDYTVTFSEPVTGVDATDFVLTQNGVIGASITGVSGSGAAYTVTVDTGMNNGLLGLNISGNPGINIMDLVGNALTGVPLASDATYTIAKIPPTVQSIVRAAATNPTNATSVDYTVTFSEAVTGVDTTDFALASGSIADASVTSVNGSGASYTVTINTGTSDGTIGLNLVDNDSIRNGFNIPLGGTGGVGTAGDGSYTGEVYAIDKTAPTVAIARASANPTNATSVDYTVTFSEAVIGVDPTDFIILASGISDASTTSVSPVSTSVYTVTINTGSTSGTLHLDMPTSATVTDLAGNAPGNLAFTGETYTIDKTPPTVQSIVRASAMNPTNATSVDYTVTFSEAVTGVDNTDFTLTPTGITGASIVNVSPISASVYTVTVNTGSGDGTLLLNLMDDNTILDTASNPLGGTGTQNFTTGDVYNIDKTAPTVVSIVRVSTTPTQAASVNYTVTFSEVVNGVDSADFTLKTIGLTGTSLAGVSGSGTTYTVSVNTGTGSGMLRLDMPSSAIVTDPAGNALGNLAFTSGEMYTTVPLATPGLYDDANAAWQYSGSWTIYTGTGPLNNTTRYTTTMGNYAEILFNGAKFTLTYVKASNRGLIDVYVDGVKVDTINAYSPTIVWQATWTSWTYPAGVHLVRFVNASAGKYMNIDAIQIYPAPNYLTNGTYDDVNSNWMYSGAWTTYTGNGPLNNTTHYTTTVGNFAEISFHGTAFILTYVQGSNRGLIDVYVDGVKVNTINAYNSTLVWKATWPSLPYAAGDHTVRFVHAGGGTYMNIDAFTVIP